MSNSFLFQGHTVSLRRIPSQVIETSGRVLGSKTQPGISEQPPMPSNLHCYIPRFSLMSEVIPSKASWLRPVHIFPFLSSFFPLLSRIGAHAKACYNFFFYFLERTQGQACPLSLSLLRFSMIWLSTYTTRAVEADGVGRAAFVCFWLDKIRRI